MKLYEKIDIEYGTRKRVFNYYKCDQCSIEYKKQKRLAEGAKMEHYCSSSCYYENNSSKVTVNCAHCGVSFKKQKSKETKSGLHFCCREHKDLAQSYMKEIQPSHYGTGSNYRAKAFKAYGKICSMCGFSNEEALEVHHIDRNRDNNKVSNLKVLCANCHTITHKRGI